MVPSPGDKTRPRLPGVSVARQIYLRWQVLVHELAKFGIVGAACYIVDVVLFNVLHGPGDLGPLTAKTISTVVAATCAYVGNRHWSFTHRARTGLKREYSLFIVLNAIGLVIALALPRLRPLRPRHEERARAQRRGERGRHRLGTIFRFWAYKRYVFLHPDHPKAVTKIPAQATESDDEERFRNPPAKPEPQLA